MYWGSQGTLVGAEDVLGASGGWGRREYDREALEVTWGHFCLAKGRLGSPLLSSHSLGPLFLIFLELSFSYVPCVLLYLSSQRAVRQRQSFLLRGEP